MEPTGIYSSKAEKYARYRWDYAPQAVEAIFHLAQVTEQSVVADIGAGTGILTRHFAGRVRHIYAVEPNDEMRRIVERELSLDETVSVLAGRAEALPLGEQSVDLITVAQALHWFEPEPAKREFLRILKPGGGLALLRNYGVDPKLNEAVERVCVTENGVSEAGAANRPTPQPLTFFYGSEHFQRLTFRFENHPTWEVFIGSLLSASYMPDETHPLYPKLERAVRQVFDEFSEAGKLRVIGETELTIGQVYNSS